jgi:uncharacterized protein YifN (PemK superfamily)
MPISFVPRRGLILLCDFDLASVHPEMSKRRRAVIISPRSYNRRHGQGPGRCLVVPFSATPPKIMRPTYVHFPFGLYQSLTKETWACCDSVTSVSHNRLETLWSAPGAPLEERLSETDILRITIGIRHAMAPFTSSIISRMPGLISRSHSSRSMRSHSPASPGSGCSTSSALGSMKSNTANCSRALCWRASRNSKPSPVAAGGSEAARQWCPWRESNPHSLQNAILNRARLPVPPHGHRAIYSFGYRSPQNQNQTFSRSREACAR